MKFFVALLSMAVVTCHAQTAPTTPTIKGHTLGESVQDFVDHSSATTRRVVQWCGTDATGFAPLVCEGITDILTKPDTAQAQLDVHCDTTVVDMLEAFPQSSPIRPTESYAKSWCADFDGDITFERDKLVRIQATIIPTGPWNQSYDTLVAKFGKPSTVQSTVVQNAFGAKFHVTKGFWFTKSYSVRAEELLNDDLSRYVIVEMMTPAYAHEQAQEEQKAHANTLD
jgi:hypothetical protein